MDYVKGKIMKVLSKDDIPKSEQVWNKEILYYPPDVVEGASVEILCYEVTNWERVKIGKVEFIQEDECNIILTTNDYVYYIKKYLN